MSNKKYYVVWKGFSRGVFDNWEDCKEQVDGFPSPEYKSFPSLELAQAAFEQKSNLFIGKPTHPIHLIMDGLYGKPKIPSICVDGSYSGATKIAEYQGVDTETGARLFRVGPFIDGTNNTMEFLAIVHALGLCKQKGLTIPIYSDSVNAMKWIKSKKARTNLVRTSNNTNLFDMINRAEKWLKDNYYSNKILKWETQAWGENPADFGRK
jgi:ribonuclease HI